METIRFVVERITHQNKENGYTVLKGRAKNYNGLVPVVGNMPGVAVGVVLTVTGEWAQTKKFGRQFYAKEWVVSAPASAYGLERYLGSGYIKGVGPKTAQKIVSHFGTDALDILKQSPDRLYEIEGLGKKQIDKIKEALREQENLTEVFSFLQEFGISTGMAAKVIQVFGKDSISSIKENPYSLVGQVSGIGFKTADKIATQLGLAMDSYIRCSSGILHVFNDYSSQGHTFADYADVIHTANANLQIEEAKIVMSLDELRHNQEIIVENKTDCYLPYLYYSEVGAARRVSAIMRNREKTVQFDIPKAVSELEKKWHIQYSPAQKKAINSAFHEKFFVITGGPGTGKSTITKAIVDLYKKDGKKVLLCAPTGRAAKRLSEAANENAFTIHRLLEASPKGGFGKNEDNPLTGDVLLADEASMIDISMFYALLRAVPDTMRVILMGDADQLPSVGPGQVLSDVMQSDVIPFVRLDTVYRQKNGSSIIDNAYRIQKGQLPKFETQGDSQCFFVSVNDEDEVPKVVADLYSKRLPKHFGVCPGKDIQVLSPQTKGNGGTVILNAALQSAVNQKPPLLSRGGTEYRKGDRVMQTQNDYDKLIFNGDIGEVCGLSEDGNELKVRFDDRILSYKKEELEFLILAYAITVHKSQGGEFPFTVLVCAPSQKRMLWRNLIYTALTRAKNGYVVVGSKRTLQYGVEAEPPKRNSKLAERIQKQVLSR